MSVERKTVPLVLYEDGERKVIGEAQVKIVDNVNFEISDSIVTEPQYEPLIHDQRDAFSLIDTDDVILSNKNVEEVAEKTNYTVQDCLSMLDKAKQEGFKGVLLQDSMEE